MPGAVTLIAEIAPVSMAAVAVAPEPLPLASVMATDGADVYPAPTVSTPTLRTLMVDVAEAPAPALLMGLATVPSWMARPGADEYPEPGVSMTMPVTAPLASVVTWPLACVPLGSLGMSKSTVGAV